MMNVDLFMKNFFSNKIEINFDMLSASMKNGISWEVHCAEVVASDDWSCGGRYVEFFKERLQPRNFSN